MLFGSCHGDKVRLRLRVNGTGNAFLREPRYEYSPDATHRFKAQTSVSFIVEDELSGGWSVRYHLLFDCGLGVVDSLLQAGITSLTHVFITHNHPDHILELDRLFQGYKRAAERDKKDFRVPCYCTAGTRANGPDKFFSYLDWDRPNVIPGMSVIPHCYSGNGVYGDPGLGLNLSVNPVRVHHGDPKIVPDPVIWVLEFDSNVGRKKIVLAWDYLHLIPRYEEEDWEIDERTKYRALPGFDDRSFDKHGLHESHEVLRNADLLVLEGNTLDPHPDTGHTSIDASLRFMVKAMKPKSDVWFVHYSGHEDRCGPLSHCELCRRIQEKREQYNVNKSLVIEEAKPGSEWPNKSTQETP